jgi:hypothetical protein
VSAHQETALLPLRWGLTQDEALAAATNSLRDMGSTLKRDMDAVAARAADTADALRHDLEVMATEQ